MPPPAILHCEAGCNDGDPCRTQICSSRGHSGSRTSKAGRSQVERPLDCKTGRLRNRRCSHPVMRSPWHHGRCGSHRAAPPCRCIRAGHTSGVSESCSQIEPVAAGAKSGCILPASPAGVDAEGFGSMIQVHVPIKRWPGPCRPRWNFPFQDSRRARSPAASKPAN